MANNRCTKALLECLRKELDGKLECSAEKKAELEALMRELEEAHLCEVSLAERRALQGKRLALLGLFLRFSIPEIEDFFRD